MLRPSEPGEQGTRETQLSQITTVGAGFDPAAKVACIVAGMITDAGSIDDLDVLRGSPTGALQLGAAAAAKLTALCAPS